MENYKVEISRSAEKSLNSLPKKDILRIIAAIQSLATDPFPLGYRKLAGEDASFRIRVGRYRVIYEIASGILLILVLKIGHRKDIYRK